MATSNRDRIGQLFEALSPPLDAFIEQAVLPGLAPGMPSWVELMRAVDIVGIDREYHPGDPMLQLKLLSQLRRTLQAGLAALQGRAHPGSRGVCR